VRAALATRSAESKAARVYSIVHCGTRRHTPWVPDGVELAAFLAAHAAFRHALETICKVRRSMITLVWAYFPPRPWLPALLCPRATVALLQERIAATIAAIQLAPHLLQSMLHPDVVIPLCAQVCHSIMSAWKTPVGAASGERTSSCTVAIRTCTSASSVRASTAKHAPITLQFAASMASSRRMSRCIGTVPIRARWTQRLGSLLKTISGKGRYARARALRSAPPTLH
jgi:hypothetical protein